jgi:hypothetical protein
MDPQLMWLSDYLEMEKEKTRYATQYTVAFMVLAYLDKKDGPDLAGLQQGMIEMMEQSDLMMAEFRKLEETDGTV